MYDNLNLDLRKDTITNNKECPFVYDNTIKDIAEKGTREISKKINRVCKKVPNLWRNLSL